jgi:formate hydrogenlyase subunit 6/NADH:ubiquinone oxidoreductase subunit I
MTNQDQYERVVRYYEFLWGPIPLREEYKAALKETLSEEEIEVAFLLPEGSTTIDQLRSLAARSGMPLDRLEEKMESLTSEGLLRTYPEGQAKVYERNTFLSFLEIQLRKTEATGLRKVSAQVLDAMIEGQLQMPTKTPLYRVIPVESTIPGQSGAEQIELNIPIADTRTPLPSDIVSEMVKHESLIAVTDCIDRLARKEVGKGCEHPINVCLAFNKFALALTNAGAARMIDAEEAIKIIRECSEMGLVTMVSNIALGGGIGFVCNCCKCACLNLNAIRLGITNMANSSRYVVEFDASECNNCEFCVSVCPTDAFALVDVQIELEVAKCIGCGLCVARCPTDALQMVLRAELPDIPATEFVLLQQIMAEAQAASKEESDESRSVFF